MEKKLLININHAYTHTLSHILTYILYTGGWFRVKVQIYIYIEQSINTNNVLYIYIV